MKRWSMCNLSSRLVFLVGVIGIYGCSAEPVGTEAITKEHQAEVCTAGSCNWQDVEFYDGSDPYFSRAFVDRYQGAFGMACSGTLISADLFLTVHHCGVPSSVGFNCQLDGTQPYPPMGTQAEIDAANALALARCEYYSVSEVVYENADSAVDMLVVRLSGLPGSKFGWIVPSVRLPPVGEEVAVFEHPQQHAGADRRKVVAFGPVTGSTTMDLQYDTLDIYGGGSGSGVVDQSGRLVGMVRGGGSTSAHGPMTQYIVDMAQPVRQAAVAVWRPATQWL